MGNQEFKQEIKSPLDVSLSGSNVQDIIVHNAVALSDTAAKYSTPIDVSKYKSVVIIVQTTLSNGTNNVDPDVIIYEGPAGQTIYNGNGTQAKINLNYASYPPNGSRFIVTNTQIPALLGLPSQILISVKANNIPTGGSITVRIIGRYN